MGILPNKKNGGSGKRPMFGMYWMYILIVACLFGLYYFQDSSQTKSVDWTDFEDAAKAGEITKIEVIPESGIAIGILTKEGAEKQKMHDELQGPDSEKRLKTNIPSTNKIQDKIDAWNEQLAAEGKPEMDAHRH